MQAIGLKKDLPNIGRIGEAELAKATALLADAVSHAKEYLETFYNAYQQKINPMLDEEVDKLATLEKKHKDYQLSLFETERKKSEAERRVDALFENFTKWVKDSMTIENNPYIRVLSVFMGV